MSQRIDWTTGIQVPGGPELAVMRSIQVEAYGLMTVEVPRDGAAETAVDIPPATEGKIQFLSITSDFYGERLVYKVNAATAEIPLDQPQIFAGAGAMALLDPPDGTDPSKLTFTLFPAPGDPPPGPEKASVRILVGWNAVSPP